MSKTYATSLKEYLRLEPKQLTDAQMEYRRLNNLPLNCKKDGEPFLGEPFGLMLCEFKDGQLLFGWSLCHERDMFKYDKEFGTRIAENRLHSFEKKPKDLVVPQIMVEDMEQFVHRCELYFQTTTSVRVLDGFALSIQRHREHSKKA